MRTLLAVTLLMLVAAGPAEAATVAQEGAEVVVRFAGGERLGPDFKIAATPAGITVPGASGCSPCPLAPIRVELAGSRSTGDWTIEAGGQPVTIHGSSGNDALVVVDGGDVDADLGAGDDAATVNGHAIVLRGGAGADALSLRTTTGGTGSTLDGGDGDDSLTAIDAGAAAIAGGAGDDVIELGDDLVQRPACGPGDDLVRGGPLMRPGAGCAAAPGGLRDGMTLGRIAHDGSLRVDLGRFAAATPLKFLLSAPAPPDFAPNPDLWANYVTRSVNAPRGTFSRRYPVKRAYRRALGRRRAALDAGLLLEAGRGDVVELTVRGKLRPAA